MPAVTVSAAAVAPILEKLALSFVAAHPDVLANFAAHAVTKVASDIAAKNGHTLSPDTIAEITTDVSTIVAALLPLLSAVPV